MHFSVRQEAESSMVREIDVWEYARAHLGDGLLIDLRDEIVFGHGTIPGAVNIPLERIRELYRLPKDRNVYLLCQSGDISREMAELLTDLGYNAFNLAGGYREYLRHCMADDEPDKP